jgi:hypothetical protein
VVECFVLSRAAFQPVASSSKVLAATSDARAAMNALQKESGSRHHARNVQLADLQRLRILGKGTFGTVFLVTYAATGATGEGGGGERRLWALKMMNKVGVMQAGPGPGKRDA